MLHTGQLKGTEDDAVIGLLHIAPLSHPQEARRLRARCQVISHDALSSEPLPPPLNSLVSCNTICHSDRQRSTTALSLRGHWHCHCVMCNITLRLSDLGALACFFCRLPCLYFAYTFVLFMLLLFLLCYYYLCLYFCPVYTFAYMLFVWVTYVFLVISCCYYCLVALHRRSERNVNLICAECLLSYFCFPSPPSPFIWQRGWKLQFFSLAPSPQYLHSMGITGNNLQRYCLSNAPLTLCIPRPINKQSRRNTATGFKPINCPTGWKKKWKRTSE